MNCIYSDKNSGPPPVVSKISFAVWHPAGPRAAIRSATVCRLAPAVVEIVFTLAEVHAGLCLHIGRA